MARTAVGALKGATEPVVMGNTVPDMDPELYGPQTLQDFEYDYWMPLEELKLAVLFSGIATLLVCPPVIDQAVGMKITVFDEEPDPIDMSKWQWFTEVSVEFPGTEPAFFGVESPGGRDAFFYPGEQLYSWELAPGKYRVRGYSRADGWREYAGFIHPNGAGIREYPTSGISWDSLPSQIRLDFWPENEPHPRKDTLEQW
ncbi:hypothetical protein CS176_0165 [Corynebacterium glutamicum]|uniref:hypothetical protein n=1 Tax=Corynebacterium glutamicum TaxID=1718 RepID=UPI00097A598F|nr:hypothetical protein [Corynebacterium glutamicum]GAV95935.1 hypothetical protein CS176_0165 [Corynebacterium glutamicum]HJE10895.1 hypothetical protein [Corynebacterium glutamicum]